MKVVFVSTKDLNKRNSVPEIRMFGVFKKRKDVTKQLQKYAESLAVETQWRVSTSDKGKGHSGGFEYRFMVVDSFEDVSPQPQVNLTDFFYAE